MFVFHRTKLGKTYDLILRKVKEKVGGINSKVFMSDDEPAFFTAWKNNMGNVEKKLLCTWHVLKNWNKHLGAHKFRNEVWQRLRELIMEIDVVTFQRYLKELDKYLENEPTLKTFRDYFNTYYLNRATEWAACYRTHLGINTNMSLENLHRELKYNYLNGKKCKRLDESFAAVRAFLRDRHYHRMIALYRGIVTTKHRKLREGHKESELLSTSTVFTYSNYYLVASSQDNFRYYKVTKEKENCRCQVKCFKCDVCVHAYWCNCYESSVRNNMCKHVHLLVRHLKEKNETDVGVNNKNNFDEDEDVLYIDTSPELEAKHEEKQIHANAVSVKKSKARVVDLSEFHQLLDDIKTPEEQKVVLRIMQVLKQQLDHIRGERSTPEKLKEVDTSKTRRAEKQPRFENKLTRKKLKFSSVDRQSHSREIQQSHMKNSIHSVDSDAMDK